MEKNPQVFVTKLDPRVTERDLEHKFGKVGDIKNIRMRGGFAFVVKDNSNFRNSKIIEMPKEQ